jgi:integrase
MYELRITVGPRRDRPGKWLVVVRRADERSTATFSSEAEALKYAAEARKDFDTNPVVAPKSWTLHDLFEAFLAAKAVDDTGRDEQIAPATIEIYRTHLIDTALPALGANTKAVSITKQHIVNFLAARKAAGKAPSTRRAEWDRLRAAFQYGVEQGVLKKNIVLDVPPPEVPEKSYEWLRSDEIPSFLGVCSPVFWLIAVVAIFLGLRRREIVFLQRGDVDLVNNVVQIRKKPHLKFTPKSGRERSIPIDPTLRPILEKHLKEEVGESNDAWVFPKENGERRSGKTRWFAVKTQEVAAAAGINRKLTFHDLRRTYGAMLIEAGVTLYETSTLMGHSDIRVTAKVYARICGKFLAVTASKLGRHIGGALTSTRGQR